KNRDTSALDNKVVFVQGEKYAFLALINARDNKVINAWAGLNSQGFAIMNSASRDLAENLKGMNQNGRLMKEALGKCADVAEFERFLRSTNGKRKVAANFGVIDAQGNACFFETSSDGFSKFDANDPRVAPQGYIIRTNFAYTAPKKGEGGGYIRFERASRLFQIASAEGRLNRRFILQQVARDLVNEKLHSHPLSARKADNPTSPLYINTNDTINRNSTASVVLFEGAPSQKESYLSTMWVILGQPICSVAVPLWVAAANVPPLLDGPQTSKLNDLARALASFLYPDQRGHMSQYLNLSRFLHYRGQGVLELLFRIENKVFIETEKKLKEWRPNRPSPQETLDFEAKIASFVYASIQASFPDIKIQE
ncbi:MAG: hypothetical protein ACE5GI_04375, partial [Candidatus Aminicenantales bacterium]